MNVTVIGVAGGTGSGKSTLVKRLQEAFKEEEVVTLCHDYYYKAHPELTYEERTKLNYDHPQSFDTDMLVEHIRTLKNNVPIEHPVYSFVDHNRTAETVLVKPSKVIRSAMWSPKNPRRSAPAFHRSWDSSKEPAA